MKWQGQYLLLPFVAVMLVVLAICGASPPGEPAEPEETTLSPDEINNEAFKEFFPDQYDSLMTNYEAGTSDPESKFNTDDQPLLPILFNEFSFSKDYNAPSSHPYALEDFKNSIRTDEKIGGGCLSCKSTAVPTLVREMDTFYNVGNLRSEVLPAAEKMGQSSVGCSDCHDPVTMELRVTRQHFIDAMAVQGVDVTKASQEEMRTYVCAQCHVSYYMPKKNGQPTSKVTLPLAAGYKADQMFYDYYKSEEVLANFSYEYISNISGAPIYKARHTDFETTMQGTHGKLGVDCADCHMPVVRGESGEPISSHFVGSPLKDMEASCTQQDSCHDKNHLKNLKNQTDRKNEEFTQMLLKAEESLTTAHYYVNKLITSGANSDVIKECQSKITYSSWLWDYTDCENSSGQHAFKVSINNLKRSIDISNDVIKNATKELQVLGVDIDELNNEIEKTKQAVIDEPDTTIKYTHATNEYFPPQKK